MNKTVIENALLINEGERFLGGVAITGDRISSVWRGKTNPNELIDANRIIDATGLLLLPGIIDDQVHFRDPGLTHKGSIESESRAAAAGGVTSFMDMPNTNPQTTCISAWEDKMQRASKVSVVNYSFFFGATNDNMSEIVRLDPLRIPGLKLFMGSSTGNMLVDNEDTLGRIFSESGLLIAVHAEEESIIKQNIAHFTAEFGEDLDINYHPRIRSAEACYASSSKAIDLAKRTGARLHLLHLSTEKELQLLSNDTPLVEKKITGEVCVHHLWFEESDYERFGNRIKWNPAIKTRSDRDALRKAVAEGLIDIVATDHAPHLLTEKEGSCLKAASGGPLVQHSLQAMLELAQQGAFSYEQVVQRMAHAPADLFRIIDRGYLRPDYFADLVLVKPDANYTVTEDNILYHCRWSPFEGESFSHTIYKTFVNGELVYTDGQVVEGVRGRELAYKGF